MIRRFRNVQTATILMIGMMWMIDKQQLKAWFLIWRRYRLFEGKNQAF
jgi:hypothetical protein